MHNCIVDTNRRTPHQWTFHQGTSEHLVHVEGRFHVNSARAVVDMAAAGVGVALAPRFALGDALASGSVVPIMENYAGEMVPISAVFLEGRALPRKIRALIDFAVKDIASVDVL